MKADDLKRQWKGAEEYVAKIGRPDHLAGFSGKVHSVDIHTQIYHQESHGAQNYWKDNAFDSALNLVIKARFSEFAADALALMRKQYEDALLAEKNQLLSRLAEIQAIEGNSDDPAEL